MHLTPTVHGHIRPWDEVWVGGSEQNLQAVYYIGQSVCKYDVFNYFVNSQFLALVLYDAMDAYTIDLYAAKWM